MAIEAGEFKESKWGIRPDGRTDEQLARELQGPFPYTVTDAIRPFVESFHRLAVIVTGHKLNNTPPI